MDEWGPVPTEADIDRINKELLEIQEQAPCCRVAAVAVAVAVVVARGVAIANLDPHNVPTPYRRQVLNAGRKERKELKKKAEAKEQEQAEAKRRFDAHRGS